MQKLDCAMINCRFENFQHTLAIFFQVHYVCLIYVVNMDIYRLFGVFRSFLKLANHVCLFNLLDLAWCRKLEARAVAWHLACIDILSFSWEWLIAL